MITNVLLARCGTRGQLSSSSELDEAVSSDDIYSGLINGSSFSLVSLSKDVETFKTFLQGFPKK